jgi:hypothetical protein
VGGFGEEMGLQEHTASIRPSCPIVIKIASYCTNADLAMCTTCAMQPHTSFPFLGISLAPGCEAAIICYYPTLGSASAELASYFIPFRPSVHGDTASSSSTQADMAIRSLRFPCRATVNHVNHDKSRVTKAAFRRRKLSAAVFNFHD